MPAASIRLTGLVLRSGLLACALLGVGWMTSRAPAQGTVKKPPVEEEEEKPSAQPKRRVPVVGDEEQEEKQSKAASKRPSRPAEMDLDSVRSSNPAVADLYKRLATPHDVYTSPTGRTIDLEPVPEFIGTPAQFRGTISAKVLDATGKTPRTMRLEKQDILSFKSYEELVLKATNEFLDSKLDLLPQNNTRRLPKLGMLAVADNILGQAIRFHESARESGRRKGPGWQDLENQLRARLQEVQIGQLQVLTDSKDWPGAFALAVRLVELYRGNKQVHQHVARLLAANAEHALKNQDLAEARRRLLVLEEQFPYSEAVEGIRNELRNKVQALVEEARKHDSKGAIKEAIAILQTAETIYPGLPGLHDYYLRLNKKYPIIYIGVQELPQKFSPATAASDSEKRAVELLFESLVKLSFTPATGQRYELSLATDMPKLAPLGRRFILNNNAFWSNGRRLTGADVRHTLQLLCDKKYGRRDPEWADMMADGARVEGDALQISLTMRQGFLSPLSLMDFKIIPEFVAQADDPDFARAPVGSGPFKLDLERSKAGESVAFTANAYYENRPGKSGLPQIREIHFYKPSTPKEDFRFGRLHALLDVPTRELKDIAATADVSVLTLRTRRIYFLAVNHRRRPLQSTALRRAVAHAINREQILGEKFREGQLNLHRPLNGPFPPASWASKPGIKPDLHDPDLAKVQAQAAAKDGALGGRLTLKFPDNDKAVMEACGMIRQQAAGAGVTLELVPRSPQDLRRDVEELHDYDFAYYHHDYPNEAYWLWPLIDPQAVHPGGRNYLGYENDDQMASLFRKTLNRRQFTAIQEWTHQIHDLFAQRLPFIPLWQLDVHHVFHNTLEVPLRIDPLLVFTEVDRWTLEKK